MSLDPLLNWPVVFDDGKGGEIPERQVSSGTENIIFKVFYDQPVKITSGFMEPSGHGYKKSPSYAIFSNDPQKIVEVPAEGFYNIGIDYSVETPDKATKAWYSG